ncbi:MAG: diacylglycerol/lipid kinase family protein, partial [Maioricimonas sp. JB049]
MKWVGFQRNPRSGAGGQHPRLMELIAGLRGYGLRPRLFSRPAELDAAVADPDRRATLHGLIAAGGDGTLLHLVNRHGDIPIGLLPLGTENLVAHYLKIPRCGRTVAKIVAEGHQQRFDVGRLGMQRFLVMASAGIDAEIIRRAHEQRTGHITRAAYVAPILASLGYYHHPELRVYVDEDPTPVT